jgi:hypothetical protein
LHVGLGEFHGKVHFQIVSRDPDRRLDMHESNSRTVTTRPTDVYQWRLLAALFSSQLPRLSAQPLTPLSPHSCIPDHFLPCSFSDSSTTVPPSPASPTRVTELQRAVPALNQSPTTSRTDLTQAKHLIYHRRSSISDHHRPGKRQRP